MKNRRRVWTVWGSIFLWASSLSMAQYPSISRVGFDVDALDGSRALTVDVDLAEDGAVILERTDNLSSNSGWSENASADQVFAPQATLAAKNVAALEKGFFRAKFQPNPSTASPTVDGYQLTVSRPTTVSAVLQALAGGAGLRPFLADPDQLDDPVPPGTYGGASADEILATLGVSAWTPPPLEDDLDYVRRHYSATRAPKTGLINYPGDGTIYEMTAPWPGNTNAPAAESYVGDPPPPGSFDMEYIEFVPPDNHSEQLEPPAPPGTHLRLALLSDPQIATLQAADEVEGLYHLSVPPLIPDLDAFVWLARSPHLGGVNSNVYFLQAQSTPWELESFDDSGVYPNERCCMGTNTIRLPVPIPEGVAVGDLTFEAYRYVSPFAMDQLTIENFLAHPASFQRLLIVRGQDLTNALAATRQARALFKQAHGLPLPSMTDMHLSGPRSEKKNLVVIGDGFATNAADQAAFTNYVRNKVVHDLFSEDVNATIFNAFNIYMIQTYSATSGITRINTNRVVVEYRDTALDWWFSGQHHMCFMQPGSNTQARTDAIITALCPEADYVVTILNVNAFGGCARGNAFAGTILSDWSVLAHEFGHMFGMLGDEYRCSNENQENCSAYVWGEPGKVNQTTNRVRARIKWKAWIPPHRPIPTVRANVADVYQDVGLFEGATTGAKKHWTGIFRPTFNSRMSDNWPLFNPVGYTQVRESARAYQEPNFRRNATGDFNGDGKTDLVLLDDRQIQLYWATNRLLGSVDPITQTNMRPAGFVLDPKWVFTGNLTAANPFSQWRFSTADRLLPGDFNGDGKTDLYIVNLLSGFWSDPFLGMLKSTGSKFVPVCRYKEKLPGWTFQTHDQHFVLDFDGDGKDDLAIYNGVDWSVPYLCLLRSTGTNLALAKLYSKWVPGPNGTQVQMGRRERIKVGRFQTADREGLLLHTPDDFTYGRFLVFGFASTNLMVPLDFHYGVLHPPGQPNITAWTLGTNDVIYPLDYNGDGVDDLALFNGLAWNRTHLVLMNNSDGLMFPERINESGGSLDIPGWSLGRRDKFWPADVDGDGREDLVAFNAENWGSKHLGVLRYTDQIQAPSDLRGSYQSAGIGSWNFGTNDAFAPVEFGGTNGWGDLFVYTTNRFGLLRGGSDVFLLEALYPQWIYNHRYHTAGWW